MPLRLWDRAGFTGANFAGLKNILSILLNKRRRRGRLGELIASIYLQINGYKILFKNKQVAHKEVDIIALRNRMLIFIEVKSGYFHPDYNPHRKINQEKRDNIKAAAMLIQRKHRRLLKLYKIVNIRYDIIFVNYAKAHPHLKHRIEHFISYY